MNKGGTTNFSSFEMKFVFLLGGEMRMRGKLYIIPDENQILQEVFYRDVQKDHLKAIQEFSDQFKLGYHFQADEYQEAPCMVALDGHLLVKTEENASLAVCYLPERVTDRQNIWLYEHRLEFSQYRMVGGYKLSSGTGKSNIETVHGIDELLVEANKRNMKCKERKDDKYVR